MDFSFDSNRRIRVRFHYEAQNNQSGEWEQGGRALTNVSGKRVFTYCEVSMKTGDDEWVGIAGNYAIKHPNDRFDKGLGRKCALANALRQIDEKEIRTAIWNNYFETHKEGWNQMIVSPQESIIKTEA